MVQDERRNMVSWRLYQFFVLWLLVRFVWSLVVPGGSWPLPPEHYIDMALDLAMLLVVIFLRVRMFATPDDPRRAFANLLCVVGVVSGLGLLGIRFTSKAAWWTGHLTQGAIF